MGKLLTVMMKCFGIWKDFDCRDSQCIICLHNFVSMHVSRNSKH